MTQIAKKQHYVPQCLLRHFASNSRVCVFDSERNLLRPNCHIRNEFAENYLYGNDNAIEELLGKVEDGAAPPIVDFVGLQIGVDVRIPPMLARFIAVQLARTTGARSEILDVTDKFTAEVVRQIGEMNDLPTDGIRVTPSSPNRLLHHQLLHACTHLWLLLLDLKVKLLVNQTATPFVLSDHPAVHYNWYFKDSSDRGLTSLTATGLQMFLPVSPGVTLCLYDSGVYKMGERNDPLVLVTKQSDVDLLNSLQIMNRESLVLFSTPDVERYVRDLCDQHERMSLHTSRSYATAVVAKGDRATSTVAVFRTQRKFGHWLSFVSIRRNARRTRDAFRERNPNFADAVQSISAQLRALRNESCETAVSPPENGVA